MVARFVFELPTFWAYELAYMITGAHFMLGIAYVLKMDRHIRIDFFYARFSPRRRALIDFITYVAFLLPVAAWMTSGPQMNMFALDFVITIKSIKAGE